MKLIKTKKFKEGVKFGVFLMNLGDAIYKARNIKGVKQEELANQIETTQRIISQIENADYNMGVKILYKIFDHLKIQMVIDGYDAISGKKIQSNEIQILSSHIINNQEVSNFAFSVPIKEVCHGKMNYYFKY